MPDNSEHHRQLIQDAIGIFQAPVREHITNTLNEARGDDWYERFLDGQLQEPNLPTRPHRRYQRRLDDVRDERRAPVHDLEVDEFPWVVNTYARHFELTLKSVIDKLHQLRIASNSAQYQPDKLSQDDVSATEDNCRTVLEAIGAQGAVDEIDSLFAAKASGRSDSQSGSGLLDEGAAGQNDDQKLEAAGAPLNTDGNNESNISSSVTIGTLPRGEVPSTVMTGVLNVYREAMQRYISSVLAKPTVFGPGWIQNVANKAGKARNQMQNDINESQKLAHEIIDVGNFAPIIREFDDHFPDPVSSNDSLNRMSLINSVARRKWAHGWGRLYAVEVEEAARLSVEVLMVCGTRDTRSAADQIGRFFQGGAQTRPDDAERRRVQSEWEELELNDLGDDWPQVRAWFDEDPSRKERYAARYAELRAAQQDLTGSAEPGDDLAAQQEAAAEQRGDDRPAVVIAEREQVRKPRQAQPNDKTDAPTQRSPETHSEVEHTEREGDPATLPSGFETDPEHGQQGTDEPPRLEAAAATEQLGEEQRALVGVGEDRRIAGLTLGGSSDGGGGAGAVTLAGAGDENRSPLASENRDLQKPGKRWRLPSLTALMGIIVGAAAIAIVLYLIVATFSGGSPAAVAPAIDGSINCEPTSPAVGDSVSCAAALSGGEPDSWSWSVDGNPTPQSWNRGDPPYGDQASFETTFNSPGSYELTLTVANDAGPASQAHTIEVLPQPPTIEKLECLPATPTVGETVECSATLDDGEPTSWSWSGGGEPDSRSWNLGDPPYGDRPVFETTFNSPGSYELTLTVANDAGPASQAHTIKVLPQPPTIEKLECLPATPTVGETVECSATLDDGEPTSWSWSGGGEPDSRSWNLGDPPYGDRPVFETTFNSLGLYELALTVGNDGGANSAVVEVQVQPPPLPSPPVIDDIMCEPESPVVDETVICSAELSGGDPTSWSWTGGDDPPTGRQSSFTTVVRSAGEWTIFLTVKNAVDDDTESFTLCAAAEPSLEPDDGESSCGEPPCLEDEDGNTNCPTAADTEAGSTDGESMDEGPMMEGDDGGMADDDGDVAGIILTSAGGGEPIGTDDSLDEEDIMDPG